VAGLVAPSGRSACCRDTDLGSLFGLFVDGVRGVVVGSLQAVLGWGRTLGYKVNPMVWTRVQRARVRWPTNPACGCVSECCTVYTLAALATSLGGGCLEARVRSLPREGLLRSGVDLNKAALLRHCQQREVGLGVVGSEVHVL